MSELDWIPRILIIDDNLSVHEDFRKTLQHDDSNTEATKKIDEIKNLLFQTESPEKENIILPKYELAFAAQGEEGLSLVKREADHPFSVAFVDIRMPPGWDGIETIRQIWNIDPNIQMVICTAYSDYSWDDTIKKLGESDNLFMVL